MISSPSPSVKVVKAKHCWMLSTNFWIQKFCWQCPAMFCLHTSTKLSRPWFEFSLKVMRSNPGYLLKSSLLYIEYRNFDFFKLCGLLTMQCLNFNKNYNTILFEEAQMESACQFLDDALPSTFFAMMFFHPIVQGLELVFC